MAGHKLPGHVVAEVVELRKAKWSWRRIAEHCGISPSGAIYAFERGTKPPEPEPQVEYTGKKTGPKSKSNSKDWSEYDGANWIPQLRLVIGASAISGAV